MPMFDVQIGKKAFRDAVVHAVDEMSEEEFVSLLLSLARQARYFHTIDKTLLKMKIATAIGREPRERQYIGHVDPRDAVL